MKVVCYNAECGDAFRLEFIGKSGKVRHILLDAGYERTFRNVIVNELNLIEKKNENIDLCIITHIHDDHIGGIISFVNAVNAGRQNDIVLQWWFNPPRISSLTLKQQKLNSIAASIGQADILTSYLNFRNALPISPIIYSEIVHEIDGLEISILSPDQIGLNKLTKKYINSKIAVEKIEDEKTSRAVASKNRDYHIRVEEFDFKGWKEDVNIENGSSIVLLTKFQGKTILWLSDSFPSIVIKSLEKLGYSKTNRLVCDYVKIAHHGSLGNNSSELYQIIKCQNYILSTDGYNLHGLPTKACLVQILTNPQRNSEDHYKFYLTCKDDTLLKIFDVDGDDIWKRLNFEIIYPKHKDSFEIMF